MQVISKCVQCTRVWVSDREIIPTDDEQAVIFNKIIAFMPSIFNR